MQSTTIISRVCVCVSLCEVFNIYVQYLSLMIVPLLLEYGGNTCVQEYLIFNILYMEVEWYSTFMHLATHVIYYSFNTIIKTHINEN